MSVIIRIRQFLRFEPKVSFNHEGIILIMCGRFSLTGSAEELKNHFKLRQGLYMSPRYNIAPGQKIPVQLKPGCFDFLHWGFTVGWGDEHMQKTPFINARAETILEKPLFRQAFQKRRCLIPADGFYEWKTLGRYKQPYYIHRKDKGIFALAGIYENETLAILTIKANTLIETVHHRMPVIISEESYSQWLNPSGNTSVAASLLIASVSELWTLYPVSPAVNRIEFDNALCVQSLQ